jgi:hypothetical protein
MEIVSYRDLVGGGVGGSSYRVQNLSKFMVSTRFLTSYTRQCSDCHEDFILIYVPFFYADKP